MNRHSPYYCNVGGKVAQLLIRRRERIVWEEVESLEDLGNLIEVIMDLEVQIR